MSFSTLLLFISCFSLLTCEENINTDAPTGSDEMNIDEMDKLLACSQLISEKMQLDHDKLDAVIKRFPDKSQNEVPNKISFDMFETCVNKIDNETVHHFFNNLTYTDNAYLPAFDKFADIDYDSYNNETSFGLTGTQMLLGTKFQQARQLAENKRITRQMEQKSDLKIMGFDINKMPSFIKGVFFLAVFAVFILGVLYLLKKVTPQAKDNKDRANKRRERKEKKKQQ
jgi:hypothetical protein